MVTLREVYNVTPAGKNIAGYAGLAADVKPTDCGNGSDFIEMDTGTVYFFDEESTTWVEFE